jgi:molybdenum cofactor synthesis domain-containing protein
LKIISLYRITSHNQIVNVDNASASPNKVSKQILLFEKKLPNEETVAKFIENTSVGTIIIVELFGAHNFNTFDEIAGDKTNFSVIKEIKLNNFSGILCLSDSFITFNINQELYHSSKIFKIKIITLSDRAYRGIYTDRSGPIINELVTSYFTNINKPAIIKGHIIPDSADELSKILEESKLDNTDVIITTGGTGVGLRDITVETVQAHLDKEIPGVMEMIRLKYGANKPNALLSRGVAGTINKTLIYTLPGSVKAVKEYLSEIFKTLDHLLYMIHGIDNH